MIMAVLSEPGHLRDAVLFDPSTGLLALMASTVHAQEFTHSTIGLRSGIVGTIAELTASIQSSATDEPGLQAQLEQHTAWEALSARVGEVQQEQVGYQRNGG